MCFIVHNFKISTWVLKWEKVDWKIIPKCRTKKHSTSNRWRLSLNHKKMHRWRERTCSARKLSWLQSRLIHHKIKERKEFIFWPITLPSTKEMKGVDKLSIAFTFHNDRKWRRFKIFFISFRVCFSSQENDWLLHSRWTTSMKKKIFGWKIASRNHSRHVSC